MAVTDDDLSGDAVSSLRKRTHLPLAHYITRTRTTRAQLSKLIHLTACKKTKHSVSRWYRTVYIPWLVASYDTHKGKRWLNSNLPKPQGLGHANFCFKDAAIFVCEAIFLSCVWGFTVLNRWRHVFARRKVKWCNIGIRENNEYYWRFKNYKFKLRWRGM